MNIAENYQIIQQNIRRAAEAAGRNADEITMLAVTKYVPVERISLALDAGCVSVGENRVQELMDKMEFYHSRNCDIHFIGQLQTNKVKYIIGKVHLIQSVDRLPLVLELQKQAAVRNLVQDVLIEVNIGEEMQKGGILPAELDGLLDTIVTMPNLHVKGLMCVPPALNAEQARPYFAKMKQLFDRIGQMEYPNVHMQHLSMGMSGDYSAAILEGATMVRVGTALFGSRVYQ